MFLRLKILVLLQISNKYQLKKIQKNGRLVGRIGLAVLFLTAMSGVCVALGIVLTKIIGIGQEVSIFTFIIVLVQAFSILSNVIGLMDNLYLAKDNTILLSYPANHNEVFLSKLIVYYIYDFIKSFFFFLPLLIGFGIVFQRMSFSYVIATLIFVVILPLFPVLMAALLTMPLIFIKKLLQRIRFVKSILVVAALIGLFLLIQQLLAALPTPLRILAMYDLFIEGFKNIMLQVANYSLFYNHIGAIFYQQNIWLNYAYVGGVLIGLLLAVFFISRPLYFKMASKSSEHATLQKHASKNKAHRNLFVTFFKKEQILAVRNFGSFLNDYAFMVATPYVFYIMMSIFASVDRNQLGNTLMIVFSLSITLMMATASNTASAAAITSEGDEFTLLKTAPGETHNMAWAKILFNVVFSTIMIIASYLLFIHLNQRIQDTTSLYVMMGASILINIGLVFWSFQIDMLNPSLSEYASTGALAHQKNASQSIKIGFGWTLLLSFVFILFFFDKQTPINFIYLKIIGLSFTFFAVRFFLFSKYLKAYFKKIEL